MKKIFLVLFVLVLAVVGIGATSQVSNVISFGSMIVGGGDSFTPVNLNPSYTPATNAGNVLTLFTECSPANHFGTFREVGTTSGYQVTGNGFLMLDQHISALSSGTFSTYIGWGDTDVGLTSATGPTNAQEISVVQNNAGKFTKDNLHAKFQANNYIYAECNPGTSNAFVVITGLQL